MDSLNYLSLIENAYFPTYNQQEQIKRKLQHNQNTAQFGLEAFFMQMAAITD